MSQRNLNGVLLYFYQRLDHDNSNPIQPWWKPPLTYELALINQPGCALIYNGVAYSVSWVCDAASLLTLDDIERINIADVLDILACFSAPAPHPVGALRVK